MNTTQAATAGTQRKRGSSWPVVVLILAAVPGFFALAFSALKMSDAYTLSLAEIRQNPEVLEELGSPLKVGFFVTGKVKTSNDDGRAAIQYSVTGPKGEGDVQVSATKHGDWKLNSVTVRTPVRQIVVVGAKETL